MADDIARFIRHFGDVPKDIKKEIRPELRAAGELVAAQARVNASWSTRIPRATRVSVSFAKRKPGVSVVVDRRKAPHARPFEHGGRQGEFRHPVYGHRDRWVPQEARPFLEPAADARAGEAAKRIENAVDRVIRADFEK
ncbi:hypothetical protein GCM10023196_035570 [Actinoallomurus vinaceus]|uniref:HK97 gp10 family phage protein n=1 Tax=Actinoallomurus vinaceus TaxID=1080074 RepID=A0ABP8UCJ0_9ACTN